MKGLDNHETQSPHILEALITGGQGKPAVWPSSYGFSSRGLCPLYPQRYEPMIKLLILAAIACALVGDTMGALLSLTTAYALHASGAWPDIEG